MKIINIIFLITCLSGCAYFDTVKRTLTIDDGDGALIDIKQRSILVSRQHRGKHIQTLVCAEPSPDAMAGYAAELAAKANVAGQGSGELTSAFQETVAFTGLRTQSIQLLRDAMYRACEAYMSGALDDGNYALFMRRYERYMVALLAIEQLTGAIRPPSVGLSTEGSASMARDIAKLQARIDTIDSDIEKLTTQKNALDATKDQKQIADITDQIAKKNKEKQGYEKAINSESDLLASGKSSVIFEQMGTQANNGVKEVATAVKEIVINVLETGDTNSLCFEFIKQADKDYEHDIRKSPLYNMCLDKIRASDNEKKIMNNY